MKEHTITYQEAYERYTSYVNLCISPRVACAEARKDIAQDTWIKIWRAWSTTTQENLQAWICKIAVNTAYDYLRRQKVYASYSLEAVMEEFNVDFAMSGPSLEEQCESMDLLRSMLDSPYGEQVRLLIASTQSISGAELAEVYGVTRDVAKTRVHRARLVIRERFKDEVVA